MFCTSCMEYLSIVSRVVAWGDTQMTHLDSFRQTTSFTVWLMRISRFQGYPSPHLHDPTEVAVGGELQALLLGPGLDVAELLPEYGPPVVTAETRLGVGHQLVEQPHVDEVEELREELDGQGGIDSTAAQ